VARRTWDSDGKRDMPTGEVFTGPHECSARGRIRCTVRLAPAGVDVDGVERELRDGAVVAARAEVGTIICGARVLGGVRHRPHQFGIDRRTARSCSSPAPAPLA
jgi:hypothetical protein